MKGKQLSYLLINWELVLMPFSELVCLSLGRECLLLKLASFACVFLCVCFCLCECISVCVHMCLCVCACVCVCVCLCVSVHLRLYMCILRPMWHVLKNDNASLERGEGGLERGWQGKEGGREAE